MVVFEGHNFSKLFSSFRKQTTKGTKFSRKMFSSLRLKSSSKPLLRKLSLRTKSSSKMTQCNLSDQLWKNNPLYVSAKVTWHYNSNDIEQTQSSTIINDESDFVKQPSCSSGVSSRSSGIYSHSLNSDPSLGVSSSGVSSALPDVSPEHIDYSNSDKFHISKNNPTYKSHHYGIPINKQSDTINITIPSTPTVPSTYAKLRLVRRRISTSSQSDADYEIHIDEYYSQDNIDLLSGIQIDDNVCSVNSYHHFYNDLVDDIQTLFILDRPHLEDNIHIGFLESIH